MILLGTVSVLVPSFMVIAYVPTILRTHGTWVVLAVLVFGVGQVAGTALVPRLIARRSAPTALRVAALGVSVSAVLLSISRGQLWLALPALLGIGLSVGNAVVPQQHRVFALVPEVAPAALGLNGSAIYVASATGAGLGGLVLASTSSEWLAPAAVVAGVLAFIIAQVARPEVHP
jgi:predicted MFS family arabinose efflux permease